MERKLVECGGACEREATEEVCVFDKNKCDAVSKTCLSIRKLRRTQRLLWLAKHSQFLCLGRETGHNGSFGFNQDSFYFVTHCTDVGAVQQTISSTICPTLCPIIPIKATHFLGWLCVVRYWVRDSWCSALLQSTGLSYFQVQTTSLFPLARTSGRLQL